MEVSPEKRQQAQAAFEALLEYQTASLATVLETGRPQVSYTPVAFAQQDKVFYLFVSELSEHTANLRERAHASLMLIADERQTEQLFARNRVTFEGRAERLERESPEYTKAAGVYGARFGKFFEMLEGLKDFQMFCFRPESIRLVVGFGAAYRVDREDWSQLELIQGK